MGETRHIEGNEARKVSQQAPGACGPGFWPNDWAAPIPGALYHRRLGWQSAAAGQKGFRWAL